MALTKITTNVIADNAINTNKLAASSVTRPDIGFNGIILQTVSQEYNASFTTTSQSYQSVFSASITPSSVNSKILILLTYAFGGKGSVTVYRNNSVDLAPATKTYQNYAAAGAGQIDWNNASIRNNLSLNIMDSPASINSVTYTVYMRTYGTTAAERGGINENGTTTYQGTMLTLLEIKND